MFGSIPKFQRVLFLNTNYSMIKYDPATRQEEIKKLKDDVCNSIVDLLDFLSLHGTMEQLQTLTKLNTTFLSLIDENAYLATQLDEAAASMVAFQTQAVLKDPLDPSRIRRN